MQNLCAIECRPLLRPRAISELDANKTCRRIAEGSDIAMDALFRLLVMMALVASTADSSRFVPDWDRGLEQCAPPSFEGVKVPALGKIIIYEHLQNN